jgi:hypothetical protein
VAVSIVGAAVALFLAGWVGRALHTQTHRDVSVLGNSFTGKIDILNTTHSAGCVQGAHQRVCSDILNEEGQALHVGDTVRAVHQQYKDSAGNGIDMLVIVPKRAP